MAKVLGESGRYVTQEAVRKRGGIITAAMVGIAIVFGLWGMTVGPSLHWVRITMWGPGVFSLLVAVLIVAIKMWLFPKLEELEQQRMNFRKGAYGEALVAMELENFPDEFYVINDVNTKFGNLDHVVIGPTGVFILDTKNWRGVVSVDNRGELLLNGHPTDKPFIRQLIGRTMGVREKIKALTNGLDPYFEAVLVFTSARVDALWGTTGNVNCIRDDQLFSYIVENRSGKRLTKEWAPKIAQAFAVLAHMDQDFAAKAKPNGQMRFVMHNSWNHDTEHYPIVRALPKLSRGRV